MSSLTQTGLSALYSHPPSKLTAKAMAGAALTTTRTQTGLATPGRKRSSAASTMSRAIQMAAARLSGPRSQNTIAAASSAKSNHFSLLTCRQQTYIMQTASRIAPVRLNHP